MKQLLTTLLVLIFFSGCQRPATKQAVPESISYLSREDWKAQPAVLPMRAHTIEWLTIHHTATRQLPGKSLADKMQSLQKFSQEEGLLASGKTKPAWADVPYHYYVDCNGAVAEGREAGFAGDSNTAYDPAGHLLIVVEGNFEEEALTQAQLKTLHKLIPAMAKKYGIPADKLGAHEDYAETLCPGKNLYALLPSFQKLISNPK
ncbi:peptidoglycan recognition protein family protein [Pontibacter mangrovi]|uniref:N-acetylmuramoyl-L-alanine amidase n=1 Tax=Pontibacter mangrovi TaxID=2589816 RepID=A0A501WA91_9BACT|nr:peptidoglycan recognition family protein [Pontibacter mangrovi]TPE46308.1 N-acetylmuramoyl-L-alanine amidase [Pontibacter mangrovi]